MASEVRVREHVLLLPFMAQGHLRPFLALANLIEQQFHYTVTLISTPLNIKNIQETLPPGTSICLQSLPFNGSDHGLPPGCENTDSAPPDYFSRIVEAAESLQPALECLIKDITHREGRRPVCLISDELTSWSVESAIKSGVFHTILINSGAYGTALFLSVWTNMPHLQTDSHVFELLPDMPGVFLNRSQLAECWENSDGEDPWSVSFKKQVEFTKKSGGVLVNTVEGLEEGGLDHLRKTYWKRVWAVGPLLPSTASAASHMSTCTDWLDLQPPRSVLYISFGSQNSIHPWQMVELAKGLEACGRAFIWVIRPPIGFDMESEFGSESLPEGFEDRVVKERKQGLVVRRWAPQLEILSHKSTGAFLSHCGWNSILESLSHGVPIIGWPMANEQFYNAKLLAEELGVGVEIARGISRAKICDADFVKMVGLVMDEKSEKGMEMREKARRIEEVMKKAAAERSSIGALEDYLRTAVLQREPIA